MPVTEGSGAVPGAIMPSHYKHAGARQAKAEFSAAYDAGWQYDPEQMQDVIRELQRIQQDRMAELQRVAQNVDRIDSPGNEEVSIGYTMQANLSGQTYKGLLQSSVFFLDSYVDTLKKIDKAYQQQDKEALKSLRTMDV